MFIFNNIQKDKDYLLKKLETLGIVKIDEQQDYVSKIWIFQCKWLKNTLKLVWEQEWVDDGLVRQDIGISIYIDNEIVMRDSFEEISKRYEGIPLKVAVTKVLLDNFSTITGKHNLL